MVREVLILRTESGLNEKDPTFHEIVLTEYSFKSPRMGMPTLTATLMWEKCLDDEWTGKEYVVLRGEKYYIRQTPTSEKANDDTRYKHSLEFKSEREHLGAVYFIDAVPDWSATYDRPNTNSTEFKFFGTLQEYADRLNCAFHYAGIGDSILNTKTSLSDNDVPNGDGYCVVVSRLGSADLTVSKELSFSDNWLWDALSEGYNQYEVPFAFRGKKIVFNEYVPTTDYVFKYGFDESLLSVKKNNANARLINRITFKGSSENIPYYYPNDTEYGHIKLFSAPNNKVLTLTNDNIRNMSRFLSKVRADQRVTLLQKDQYAVASSSLYFQALHSADEYLPSYPDVWHEIYPAPNTPSFATQRYKLEFTVGASGAVVISAINGASWNSATATRPAENSVGMSNLISSRQFNIVDFTDKSGLNSYKDSIVKTGTSLQLPDLMAGGTYVLLFDFSWPVRGNFTYWLIRDVVFDNSVNKPQYYWANSDGDLIAGYNDIGLDLPEISAEMVGDSFSWTAESRMPFQTNLMPPKYRETGGAERFYNAVNNTYPNGDGGYWYFKNPYVAGNPNEYIYEDDTIKPTIEGVKNSSGDLFGVIADIAFDANDNDSLKSLPNEDSSATDALSYEHSFFYIRLNKFDGEFGFDLFGSASQTDAMTIQMTSGRCNGCKFKVQVIDDAELDERMWRNPVQVYSNGNIYSGDYDTKVNKKSPQEQQQDTRAESVWICLQKDIETFGVIMPNQTHNYLPEVGDTFNIINIDLPKEYITAAEKRGEAAMLDFMANNNEEKFTFDISASRIFFAENPQLLAELDENSRIAIEYNGHTYYQYVSEFGIECKDGEALPDVKITLVDELSVGESFIQEIVNSAVEMSNSYGSQQGGGGGIPTELADKRYLRKDQDDQTEHGIRSNLKFELGDFVSGTSGGIFFIDQLTGESVMELDRLKVRMKAVFEELEIDQTNFTKGEQVITPGGGVTIMFVEEKADCYRCYFKNVEDEKGFSCSLQPNDEVLCKEFNITDGLSTSAANKFYWRLVTAVNNIDGYIDLSKTICAENSDVPAAGDVIVHYGSHTDASRMNAIVFSTMDSFSPSITLHSGITHFNDDGTAVIQMGVNKAVTPPRPFFNCYGETFIGPKDEKTYIRYTPENGVEIKAKLSVLSTVGDEVLADYIKQVSPPVEQEDIEDYVNAIVDPKINGIQNQIDGVIETWFFNGVPTLTNYPAVGWVSSGLEAQHLGDLYYDNDTGTAYRFSQDPNGDYYWNQITDEAITKALAAAKQAQDTANNKRRVFTSQPTLDDVYDVGDLWVNATYGSMYNNDLLRCISHKDANKPFNIDDWGLASKYTDDALAKEANRVAEEAQKAADDAAAAADEAKARLNQWAADGVISPTEKQGLKDEISRIDGDYIQVEQGYSQYPDLVGFNQYKAAYQNYRDKLESLTLESPEVIEIPYDFTSIQLTYYNERSLALTNIADAAKKYAEQFAENAAKEAIAGYEYLKEAMVNGASQFQGGLILSSHIRLGAWENSGEDTATMVKVYAGMNGIYHDGRTIASWWGGDMVDRFDALDNQIYPIPDNAATALVRMDGSAYFSQGNIGFRKDGSGWLGNPETGIHFSADGVMTFGSGIKIDLGGNAQLLNSTLSRLLTIVNGINAILYPVDSSGNRLEWGNINTYAIKSEKGLYSLEFLSARGQSQMDIGGSGGSAGAQYNRLDSWTGYTSAMDGYVLSAKLGYELYTQGNNTHTKVADLSASVDEASLNISNIEKHVETLQTSINECSASLLGVQDDVSVLSDRLDSIAGAGALSVSIAGSGNAVTSLTLAGATLIAHKDETFLTNEVAKTKFINIDGSNATQELADALINALPQNLVDIGDSLYFITSDPSALPYNKYRTTTIDNIWRYIVRKSSGVSGVNADTLDGVHDGEVTAARLNVVRGVTDFNAVLSNNGIYTWEGEFPSSPGVAGAMLQWSNQDAPNFGSSGHYIFQLASTPHRILAFRQTWGSSWSDWRSIAFEDGGVEWANRLGNKRNLWGQVFDGTADITGDLTGVGSITHLSQEAVNIDENGNLKFDRYKKTNWKITNRYGETVMAISPTGGICLGGETFGNATLNSPNGIQTEVLYIGDAFIFWDGTKLVANCEIETMPYGTYSTSRNDAVEPMSIEERIANLESEAAELKRLLSNA